MNRRYKGKFYTPTLFVDHAHRMIEKQLGEDWREKYVVWDNCCGSLNLTRDYRFKELYASTMEEAELEVGKHYNREATKFVFDFLNDRMDKLPQNLLKAFEQNKPIVFFINPPYATAANKLGYYGDSKKGVAASEMNRQMKAENCGAASQNLYAQFLYRIMKIKERYGLTDVYLYVFCPTLFLTGSSWAKFRTKFLRYFSFEEGILFKASHFANCSDNWGISFSMWTDGETADRNNFPYTLTDIEEGNIAVVGKKIVYNIDGLQSASEWCKEPVKKLKTFETPNLSSAIILRSDTADNRGRNFENSLGYFLNAGNNVNMNTHNVALFSTAYGNGNGCGINSDNFTRCTALFAARKLVTCDWINSKDEYIKPNIKHPFYKEFELDSVIYSLYHSASNQSSLRNIEYKGNPYNIKNEFFWMSIDEIRELADNNDLDETYQDSVGDKNRHTYLYIKEHYNELSQEAKDVYDMSCEMMRKSMRYRNLFNEEHEEYQIFNWDCGFYQMKALYKEFMKEDFEKFKELYKKLSNKMFPMVYELGFLKK